MGAVLVLWRSDETCHCAFVWDSGERIVTRTPRIGRILTVVAVHPEHLFGFAVERFKIGISYRPCWGGAVDVLHRFKVIFAEPWQCRTVELGVAAYIVIVAG